MSMSLSSPITSDNVGGNELYQVSPPAWISEDETENSDSHLTDIKLSNLVPSAQFCNRQLVLAQFHSCCL